MNIEMCDWCGSHKDEGEGATVKIYEHRPDQTYENRLWGNTYVICKSCLLDIKKKL